VVIFQSAALLLGIAVIGGTSIGLIAKRRRWPAKQTFKKAYLGFSVFLIFTAFVLEILLGLHLPWPPRVLAQSGFPLAAVVAVAYFSLFAWLAASLAKRLRSSSPKQP
jgi:ABC-type antimicrobial peptide transport system permease subunit